MGKDSPSPFFVSLKARDGFLFSFTVKHYTHWGHHLRPHPARITVAPFVDGGGGVGPGMRYQTQGLVSGVAKTKS